MVTGNMHGKSCISDPSDVLPSDHPSAFAKINFIPEGLLKVFHAFKQNLCQKKNLKSFYRKSNGLPFVGAPMHG